jgi:hypothetical protein
MAPQVYLVRFVNSHKYEMSVTKKKTHLVKQSIGLQWSVQNGVSLYVSDQITLQWTVLPRNVKRMLLSEDFLKEKATNYIPHSFEKDKFYVIGVIQWIHRTKKVVLWRRSCVTLLPIRKQIVTKVSPMIYWMLICQLMATLMKCGVKRYNFTAALLLRLPFSAIHINTENKNFLNDEVVSLTRRPVRNQITSRNIFVCPSPNSPL